MTQHTNPAFPAVDPIQDAAGQVVLGIAEQTKPQDNPGSTPSPTPKAEAAGGSDGPPAAWRKEPKRNFELDAAGNVKTRGDGSPVRRGGRPRKPRKGDELADGSIFEPGQVNRPKSGEAEPPPARVVLPGQEPGGGGDAGQAGPTPEERDEFGAVLVDGCFDLLSFWLGDGEAKPTANQQKAASRHASRVFGRWTPHPLLALLIVLIFSGGTVYAGRRSSQAKASQAEKDGGDKSRETPKNKGENGDSASTGGRADAEWQDAMFAEGGEFDAI